MTKATFLRPLLLASFLCAYSAQSMSQELWKDRFYFTANQSQFATGTSAPELGKAFFVSDFKSSRVVEVDLGTESIGRVVRLQRFESGARGADIQAGTRFGWFLGQDLSYDARLVKIDLTTMERLQTHILAEMGTSGLVSSLVIDEQRDAAFFLDGLGGLRRANLQDGSVSAPVQVSGADIIQIIVPDSNSNLYLLTEQTLGRFDAESLSQQAVNNSLADATTAAISPSGASILVFESQIGNRAIRKYDAQTLELEGEMGVSFSTTEQVGQFLFSAAGDVAYGIPSAGGQISKIDVNEMQLIARSDLVVPPGVTPFGFVGHAVLDEAGGKILLGRNAGDALRLVSTDTLEWLGDIETPPNERALRAGAVIDDGRRIGLGLSVGDFGTNGRVVELEIPAMLQVDQIDLERLESPIIDIAEDSGTGELLAAYGREGLTSGIVRLSRAPLLRIAAHEYENVRFQKLAYDFANRAAYFVSYFGNLGKISLENFQILDTQNIGAQPSFLSLDLDRRVGYTEGMQGFSDIFSFDLDSLELLDSLQLDLGLGQISRSIANAVVQPERNRAFVGINLGSGSLTALLVEITLEPMELVRYIPMPDGWVHGSSSVNVDGSKALFASSGDQFSRDSLAIVDLDSLMIERVAEIPEQIVDNHGSAFLALGPAGVNVYSGRSAGAESAAAVDRFDVETIFESSFE